MGCVCRCEGVRAGGRVWVQVGGSAGIRVDHGEGGCRWELGGKKREEGGGREGKGKKKEIQAIS